MQLQENADVDDLPAKAIVLTLAAKVNYSTQEPFVIADNHEIDRGISISRRPCGG